MAISVQKQFTVHIPSGQQASNQNVTIPAGKTMTITHVSGRLYGTRAGGGTSERSEQRFSD